MPETMPPTVTSSPLACQRGAGIVHLLVACSSSLDGPSLVVLEVGNGAGAELAEVGGVRVDGMAGPEQPDGLLLGIEQLDVAPGRRVGQRRRARLLVALGAAASKERALTELLVALDASAVVDRRIERGDQPRAQHARRQRRRCRRAAAARANPARPP